MADKNPRKALFKGSPKTASDLRKSAAAKRRVKRSQEFLDALKRRDES